jgi:ethanolamine utilization cobalamin adenosyltransferase
MKILTETMLRAATLAESTTEYCVEPDVFVTPLAREYLRDRGIALVIMENQPSVMTRTPLPKQGKRTYIDAQTGAGYSEKPEHMTHLRSNLLVPKTHPRIAFRGQLDTLQAEIICLQAEASEKNKEKLVKDLADILYGTQCILGAEVKDEPLEPMKLLGMEDKALREHSHNVKKYIGIDHPIPDYTMGRMAADLNRLRTKVREVELSAANAFMAEDGSVERPDIIKHLNRLSSGVYIIFCRWLAGYYEGGR